MDLVNAQQARRALDYLVGFNLSPLLWKKVRQGLSAGRVQSPALRMICEREDEIAAFVAQEYWTIDAELAHTGAEFPRQAGRVPGPEGRAVQLRQRGTGARRRAHPDAQAAGGRANSPCSSVEQAAAQAQPRAAVHDLNAAAGSRRKLGFSAQRTMRSRSSCTKASISAKARSASSPTCVPTRVKLAQEAVDRDPRTIERLYGKEECRGGAARLQDQVQERAGSARGDPSDDSAAIVPAEHREVARRRPVQAVLADLEARRRLPDGARGIRHRRGRHAAPAPTVRRSAPCCAPTARPW